MLENKTIEISLDEYYSLLHDRVWLDCLEEAGVDNWEGIEEAIRILREKE